MQFLLTYEGDLQPGKNKNEYKWILRQHFDQQLRRLWEQPPLSGINKYRDKEYRPSDCYLGQTVNGIECISFISEIISTRADIEISLLSAHIPGKSVYSAGDIDNRLKVVVDALRAPQSAQEFPAGCQLPEDGRLYCLLADDRLITRLAVDTYQFLRADEGSKSALAIVKVQVKAIEALFANLGIAS